MEETFCGYVGRRLNEVNPDRRSGYRSWEIPPPGLLIAVRRPQERLWILSSLEQHGDSLQSPEEGRIDPRALFGLAWKVLLLGLSSSTEPARRRLCSLWRRRT